MTPDGKLLRRALVQLERGCGAETAAPGRRRSVYERCRLVADRLDALAKDIEHDHFTLCRDLLPLGGAQAARLIDLHKGAVELIAVIGPALRHVDEHGARGFDSAELARAVEALARVFDELRGVSGHLLPEPLPRD